MRCGRGRRPGGGVSIGTVLAAVAIILGAICLVCFLRQNLLFIIAAVLIAVGILLLKL